MALASVFPEETARASLVLCGDATLDFSSNPDRIQRQVKKSRVRGCSQGATAMTVDFHRGRHHGQKDSTFQTKAALKR